MLLINHPILFLYFVPDACVTIHTGLSIMNGTIRVSTDGLGDTALFPVRK